MTKLLLALSLVPIAATGATQSLGSPEGSLLIRDPKGSAVVTALAPDVVRIDYRPGGNADRPTEIMDASGLRAARPMGTIRLSKLQTKALKLTAGKTIEISTADGRVRVSLDEAALSDGVVRLRHLPAENLYGMRGIALRKPLKPNLSADTGLVRNDGAPVAAGAQGDGGAPLAYSTHWGVFVDSVDGAFKNDKGTLEFSGGSRKDVEAYIVLGPPKRTIEIVTALTGRPPMPPKWALGFMNSQWGTTQKEVLEIVAEYRKRQIPLDAFILDFDYKAWGEDDFGEWRWNSTSGPGNVSPNKYPDGASGAFGKQMAGLGVHLVGIMKPRILTQKEDLTPTKAAAEANEHEWWMPGKKPYLDYFSHRLANDLDFSKPDVRDWYWRHASPLFASGIAGWWNDEADDGFDSLGFFHMQQSLYEGQRRLSDSRAWSLNRNFYSGAQRFAFGTWSGDIRTGFNNMADQRARMLTIIDLGQPHWSMDSGGFGGMPEPENYARWIEFAAMVPIMRVHGSYNKHRQPWVYGPVAEAAATRAIDFRYSLQPYLYSLEHSATSTGIGIVRPLFWEFPDDPHCANSVDSWMLGDSLLASPVVEEKAKSKAIYLPAGRWFDYWTGEVYKGGKAVTLACDTTKWTDMPLFVRGGAILASQTVMQFTSEQPVEQITLDVWPDASRQARFEVYDDDGTTVACEKGSYFSQWLTSRKSSLSFGRATGPYRTSLKSFLVRLHGVRRTMLRWNGQPVPSNYKSGVISIVLPAGVVGDLRF